MRPVYTEIVHPAPWEEDAWTALEEQHPGLEFDNTHCAECERPIAHGLYVDRETGNDRSGWVGTFVGPEGELVCEDCIPEGAEVR